MPSGYGLSKSTRLPAADAVAIAKLHFTPTTSGTAIVLDAETAVRAIAAQRDVALSVDAADVATRSTSVAAAATADSERLEIVGAVLIVLLGAGAVRLTRVQHR
jgi:hypothetical protein